MQEVQTKTCSQCDLELPVSEFYKVSISPLKLKKHCKTCERQYQLRRKEKRLRLIEAGVIAAPETKTCRVCGRAKPASEFYPSASHRDGLMSMCKPCSIKDSVARHKRVRYGLSDRQHAEMLSKCESRCQICGGEEPMATISGLCVDHCHETGIVRGLLCSSCNKGLGSFKDNPELLLKAAAYLARYKQEVNP